MRNVPEVCLEPVNVIEIDDAWSFYIFSRRSAACERAVGERDVEVGQQLGMLDHLFAQERDQIEARRAMRVTSPFGERRIDGSACRPEGEQRRQEQRAVGGHREHRLLRDLDARQN